LFEIGVAGVDPGRNVAIDALLDDCSTHQASARLWPQTERLKAAVTLARRGDSAEGAYLAHAVGAARSLRRYLETDIPGLWRDSLTATGAFLDQPAPASSFYHIVCGINELQMAAPYLGQGDMQR
jgi:mannose-6-phosphate isomerase